MAALVDLCLTLIFVALSSITQLAIITSALERIADAHASVED